MPLSDDEEIEVYDDGHLSHTMAQSSRRPTNHRNPRALPAATRNPSLADQQELRAALGGYQVQNEDLRTELEQARLQLQELQVERRSGASASASAADSSEEKEAEDAASRLGRSYGIMHFPWVWRESVVEVRPNVDLSDVASRFQSENTQAEARKAEIYDLIHTREDVAGLLEKNGFLWVSRRFRHGVSDQKSKFVNATCNVLGDVFPTMPSAMWKTPDDRKKNATFQHLVGTAGDLYPPALYAEDHQEDCDNKYLFFSKAIPLYIKVGLRGPTSIHGGKHRGATKADLWGIQEVTPGVVALAAVVHLYHLSGKSSFVPPKEKTIQYNWPLLHATYTSLLTRRHNQPRTRQLFEWLNGFVFEGRSITPAETSLEVPQQVVDRNRNVEEDFGAEAVTSDEDVAGAGAAHVQERAEPAGQPVDVETLPTAPRPQAQPTGIQHRGSLEPQLAPLEAGAPPSRELNVLDEHAPPTPTDVNEVARTDARPRRTTRTNNRQPSSQLESGAAAVAPTRKRGSGRR